MKLPMSSKGVSPVDDTGAIRGMRTRVDIKYHETP